MFFLILILTSFTPFVYKLWLGRETNIVCYQAVLQVLRLYVPILNEFFLISHAFPIEVFWYPFCSDVPQLFKELQALQKRLLDGLGVETPASGTPSGGVFGSFRGPQILPQRSAKNTRHSVAAGAHWSFGGEVYWGPHGGEGLHCLNWNGKLIWGYGCHLVLSKIGWRPKTMQVSQVHPVQIHTTYGSSWVKKTHAEHVTKRGAQLLVRLRATLSCDTFGLGRCLGARGTSLAAVLHRSETGPKKGGADQKKYGTKTDICWTFVQVFVCQLLSNKNNETWGAWELFARPFWLLWPCVCRASNIASHGCESLSQCWNGWVMTCRIGSSLCGTRGRSWSYSERICLGWAEIDGFFWLDSWSRASLESYCWCWVGRNFKIWPHFPIWKYFGLTACNFQTSLPGASALVCFILYRILECNSKLLSVSLYWLYWLSSAIPDRTAPKFLVCWPPEEIQRGGAEVSGQTLSSGVWSDDCSYVWFFFGGFWIPGRTKKQPKIM